MVETEIVVRRRKWTPAEKAALLAEVEAEGGRVSVVARRHGISDSLLYNWRSAWKAALSMRNAGPEPVEFVPLGVIGPTTSGGGSGPEMVVALDEPSQPPPLGGPRQPRQQGGTGLIEIDLPNGARVRVDALVDETALQRVFRAMKGAGSL